MTQEENKMMTEMKTQALWNWYWTCQDNERDTGDDYWFEKQIIIGEELEKRGEKVF